MTKIKKTIVFLSMADMKSSKTAKKKKVLKIKADYNQFDQADYEFNSLNEIEDPFFINLIKENNL